MTRSRLVVLAALVGLLSALGLGVAGASDPGIEPTCQPPTTEGDLELGTELGPGEFRNVRVGQHECFDRVVFHVDGVPANGVRVKFVDELLADPKGDVIEVPNSGAILQVVVPHVPKQSQAAKFAPGDVLVHQSLARFTALRAVVGAGCFEGQCTVGVGLSQRTPFRAFTLPPEHGRRGLIVVDIAHDPAIGPE